MSDSQELVNLELPGPQRFSIRGWQGLERWNTKLQEAWAWARANRASDPNGAHSQLISALDQIGSTIEDGRSRGESLDVVAQRLPAYFEGQWGPYHQDSPEGLRILDIQRAVGSEAAVFALALLRGSISMRNMENFNHFKGAQLLAMPATGKASDVVDDLRRERSAIRTLIRTISDRFETETEQRKQEFTRQANEHEAIVRGSGKRAVRVFREWFQKARQKDRRAISDIRAVEKAYREHMSLKAPVDYWRDKAKQHDQAESELLWSVQLFFAVSVIIVACLFWFVGRYLVGLDKNEVHPSIFFVASAGLASIVAIVLWVGRLVTKIYLSEQHLRQDAREREVMTTTYLALIAEKAASPEDRQVILSALFRPTADGIVKEEGGLDPSIASALAKYLSKPG